jgi:phosphoribosylanthranilate isomerase
MVPVKICGITNPEDALACQKLGVAALGFVFAESKRRVTVEQVYRITQGISPFIIKVGVFVDEDPLRIKEIMRDCRLDLAQLHGKETPNDCEVLEGRVIKGFRAGQDRPDSIWKGAAIRGILVDSYSAESAGGTGRTFDWKLAADYRGLGVPLILAGGLNPDNIEAAIRIVRPDGVDLSSGVERVPGVKDPGKIERLMSKIKGL